MVKRISDNVEKILACSYCGHHLDLGEYGAVCGGCGLLYQFTNHHALDLRLKKPKKFDLQIEMEPSLYRDEELGFELLRMNDRPSVDFSNVEIPNHLSKEIMSYFPRANSNDSLVLDLGCGDAIHRNVCEYAGFEWVGLDYNSECAPILGDAHCLPFELESFDFVLCIAVLALIQYPLVMMKEVYRVMKPGGVLIGTVAFLEPFADSFYHYTHLGTTTALRYGGFDVLKVAPSQKWSALVALAHMALFPRMPKPLSRSIVRPIEILHKLWWRVGSLVSSKAVSNRRIRDTTGAFTFIAKKP